MIDIVPVLRSISLRLDRTAAQACVSGADEITKLRADEVELRAALTHVREIIKEGALTGFNCHDGDWAERLFASQGVTFNALRLGDQQTGAEKS